MMIQFQNRTSFSSLCIIVILSLLVGDSQQSRRVRAVSSGGDQLSGKIANFAMKALGSFKSFMKEGNNDLGIPKLDPVFMDNFNYSLDTNSPGGGGFKMDILFESPALVGLSTYELNGASELGGGPDGGTTLQMTIVFPAIQIRGRYTAKGNMFQFFNLGGSGDFEIIGSSQVLAAEAKLRPVNQTLFVDYITSQFVGGRVKSQFSNDATSSTGFSGLMSDFLSAMGTRVFDTKLKNVITTAMNDYMKEWLNGAFSSVAIHEILGEQVSQGVPPTPSQQHQPVGVTYVQQQPQQQNYPQPQPQPQPAFQQNAPQSNSNNQVPAQQQPQSQQQQPNQQQQYIQLQQSPSSNFYHNPPTHHHILGNGNFARQQQ